MIGVSIKDIIISNQLRIESARQQVVYHVELFFEEILHSRSIDNQDTLWNNIEKSPLLLDNLHPNVIRVAGKLFEDEHYRSAILDTYIDLVNRVKDISGRHDLAPLMQQVFSIKNPKIIVSGDQDEQQGFMWLFSGAVMAIRNPKAHKIMEQSDPQRAIEWLAFASVLHRVLDDNVSVNE
jgi:uncharacterized protein (TIGR02391 family)